MKKLLLMLLVMTPLFAGCSTLGVGYKYSYKFENNNDKVAGEISDSSRSNMKYSDNWINAFFYIEDSRIRFSLENKTDSALKIIWDECSIVKFGISEKTIHEGIKYINRNESQSPTIIPPHASIVDFVLPAENVYYNPGSGTIIPGGWQEYDLFSLHDYNNANIKKSILDSKGKKFSLYLPIQCQGKTIGYNFNFIITDVKPVNN